MASKQKIFFALILLATPVIFFSPLFLTYGLGPMEDDLIQYFPQMVWLGENLQAERFPLWNRFVYGGYPAAGDPQSGIFYPLNWLSGAIRPHWAYPALLIIHYWIAGWGMYRLGRAWGLTRFSSITGAVLWMFSGFMLGHRTHYTILASAAWMSVIFFLWTKIRQSNRPRLYFSLIVIVQGFQILSGHVQVAAMTAIAVLLYLLITTSKSYRLRIIVAFIVSHLLAFGLSAIQLFPVWQVYSESVRSANSYRFITENSFLPVAWPMTIAPASLGMRIPNFLYSFSYFGPWNQCELICFTTLTGLTLAFFAIWSLRKDPGQQKRILFFLILLVVSLFLALGRYNPAFKLLYYLPIFRPFRCPARYLIWFNFAAASLAMIGMQMMIDKINLDRFRRFAPVFILIVMGLFAATFAGAYYLVAHETVVEHLPPSMAHLPDTIRQAVHPLNPALLIPMIVAGILLLLCLVVRTYRLRRYLLILILVEIAAFAPFYDVDFEKLGTVELYPQAARTLDRIDPARQGLIWPTSRDPYIDPLETLQPFTNMLVERPAITGYGPLLSRYHRRLFGWNLWPTTDRYWEILTQDNLLGRYGIRFIVADKYKSRQIQALKELAPVRRDPARHFITSDLQVSPDEPFYYPVRLDAGLYRLRFQARRLTPDQFRLYFTISGMTDPLWSDQQLCLETWDLDDEFRRLDWYFFIPPQDAQRPLQLNVTAYHGQGDFLNMQMIPMPFNLDHLEPHQVDAEVTIFENHLWRGEAHFAQSVQMITGKPLHDLRLEAIDHLLLRNDSTITFLAVEEPMELPERLGDGEILEFHQQGNRVEILAEVVDQPGLLVIPAGFDVGWQADIDGLPAQMLCADGISRAILVPPGEHRITLTYFPDNLIVGLAITIFTVLILAILLTGALAEGSKRKT